MIRTITLLAALALTLSGCATTARYDAAGDVHALLVAIRDNDRVAFDRHVDRRALKNNLESRVMREVGRRKMDDGARALAAIIAPGQGYGKAARAWAHGVIYPADEDSRTVEVRVRFGPSPAGERRCS